MRKLLLLFILFPCQVFYCQTAGGGVTDIDGNFYPSVIIGSQEWTTANLRVTHYQNGDSIPYQSPLYSTPTQGRYFNYDHNSLNVPNLGRLYSWYAVNDTRNLAPAGWHIPTIDEWNTLRTATGSNSNPTLVKTNASTSWNCTINFANNLYNFNVIPSGRAIHNNANGGYATYSDINQGAYFWTASTYTGGGWQNSSYSVTFSCSTQGKSSSLIPNYRYDGLAIRLVKNAPLSIGEWKKSKVSIYPNPTNGLFNVKSENEITELSIIDITGKTVFIQKKTSTTINIEHLDSGLYIIKVSTSEGVYSQKLIKE